MGAEPVATLHVLGSPREQQLAEAETRDEDIRLADLAGGKLDPFDRITRIINFDALAGGELSCGDIGLELMSEKQFGHAVEARLDLPPIGAMAFKKLVVALAVIVLFEVANLMNQDIVDAVPRSPDEPRI